MLAWLSANLSTILVGLVVLALLAAVVFYMICQKKRGESSCGCGCANCAMHDTCHESKPKQNEDNKEA